MLSIRTLSPKLQEIAIKELNENPATLAEDIEHVRQWILQQPHLRARTDDQFILNILRLCKFDKEKAMEKIDLALTVKTVESDLTFNRNPMSPEVLEILDLGMILPLKKAATPEGPRIIIMRVSDFDFNKHSVEALAHVIQFHCEVLFQEDDNLIISGYRIVIDLQSLTMNLAMEAMAYANNYKHLTKAGEQLSMFTPHGYHVIHADSMFEMLFNVYKCSLSDSVNEMHFSKLRFYDEDDFDGIYEDIPLSVLPKDYGGESESIVELTAYWKEKILSHKDMYLKEEQYSTIEHLRSGTSPYIEEANLDPDISLRKLDID